MPQKVLACIQCGAILNELKCKLKCSRCGYFEDCLRPYGPIGPEGSDGGTNLAQETHA